MTEEGHKNNYYYYTYADFFYSYDLKIYGSFSPINATM